MPLEVLTIPAYTYREAAHYLVLPVSTLRAWCRGTYYGKEKERRYFEPVISPDGDGEGLSFLNLVEGFVLSAIRRVYKIPLPKVRRALDYVEQELGINRPLADAKFETDGISLFLRTANLIQVTDTPGQYVMDPILVAHLQRIGRDDAGVPIKLYPFTRRGVYSEEALAPIEISPTIAFGRAVLKGSAVPTDVIAERFKGGDTISELADDLGTTPLEIEEIVRVELDRAA